MADFQEAPERTLSRSETDAALDKKLPKNSVTRNQVDCLLNEREGVLITLSHLNELIAEVADSLIEVEEDRQRPVELGQEPAGFKIKSEKTKPQEEKDDRDGFWRANIVYE